jgi:hypothetical protein
MLAGILAPHAEKLQPDLFPSNDRHSKYSWQVLENLTVNHRVTLTY